MQLSRRDFLQFCGTAAAAFGLSMTEMGRLEELLASSSGPSVLWLQGAACTGCSVSFLNYISSGDPSDAADLLINHINLEYHPNVMAAAGETAVGVAEAAYNRGGYILAVEGGVPTAFGGNTCWPWTHNGEDVTFQDAVVDIASKASKILCVGNCAAWGGMAAAPPNPTRIKGVGAITGKPTINIAGCPPHPDWIVWVVAQLLLGNSIPLDSNSRPTQFFSSTIHSKCPREDNSKSSTFGVDNQCLKNLGCRGPVTRANCQSVLWNNKKNWCIDANAPCLGCTEPTFPGPDSFRKTY